MNIIIKLPVVLIENIVFTIFPKGRNIIEKYLYNPYAFNEDHIKYSKNQFENFCQKIGGASKISDKTILELGPGGSIGFGLLCLKNGAKKYYAIDDGEHTFLSKKQFDSYKKLLDNNDFLIKQCFSKQNNKWRYNHSLVEFIKINQNSAYDLPNDSIDIIYSCAVLEHVHNLDLCFSEMTRVLRPKAIMHHEIDLRDHIFSQNSLWFLKMSDFWFNLLFKSTGEYVNRKRFSYYKNLIKKYNLKIINLVSTTFKNKQKNNYPHKFIEEDLKTQTVVITLQK